MTVQLHLYILFIFFFIPEKRQLSPQRRNKILGSLSDASGKPPVSYSDRIFLSSHLCTHRYTQIYVGVRILIYEQLSLIGGFCLLQ